MIQRTDDLQYFQTISALAKLRDLAGPQEREDESLVSKLTR